MPKLANNLKSTTEVTDVPPSVTAAEATQGWLAYLQPVRDRAVTAMMETQNAIEKRLGFCPGKEAMKVVSKGLEVAGNALIGASKRLRSMAQSAPPTVAGQDVGVSQPN
jgi:hypothetical protein